MDNYNFKWKDRTQERLHRTDCSNAAYAISVINDITKDWGWTPVSSDPEDYSVHSTPLTGFNHLLSYPNKQKNVIKKGPIAQFQFTKSVNIFNQKPYLFFVYVHKDMGLLCAEKDKELIEYSHEVADYFD